MTEAGDRKAAGHLLATLDADQLREVLLAQTDHVSLIFESAFGVIFEHRLPALAEELGYTREQVVADYLERLTLRFALAEVDQQ